jgi:hypothetical protein
VNYDSEGDCKFPTDREWTWIEITNRETKDAIEISSQGENWKVTGEDPIAARTAMLLIERCSATVEPSPNDRWGSWDDEKALARAVRVAEEFSSPKLKIFDSHIFWGSWKWIGWFATDCTWAGRWIMLSVLRDDARGVNLCIEWLKHGTFNEAQSNALRHALHELAGEAFNTDADWIKWYEGGWLKKGAKIRYPEPDFNAWLSELKEEYGDG